MVHVRDIQALLKLFSDQRELLPRSLSEIIENLQQFYVVLDKNHVVGCCALYITWIGLAEVKALAVAPSYQGKGLGKRLLKTILQDAKKLGVETLFALTIRENLFKKFGFRRAKKIVLPHKVWTECVRCPYFPDHCIETSLTLDLRPRAKKTSHTELTQNFMSTAEPTIPNEPTKTPRFPPPPPK